MKLNTRTLRAFALFLALQTASLTQANDVTPPIISTRELESRDIVGPYLQRALEQNHGLKVHDRRYLAARASISSTSALPNPKIQITHFVESVQTRTGPQEQALSIQQPIPWLGKLRRKQDAAEAQAEALWHAYANQQFQLIEQVSKAVLERAYLEKAIEIGNNNTKLLQGLETIVEERVKSGGELSDLLKLQIETERSIDAVNRLRSKLSATSFTLNGLLGQNPDRKMPATAWDAPLPLASNPENWITAINERSPQIAMLHALKSNQNALERLANMANKPDFNIGINYINTGEYSGSTLSDSGKDPWAIMVGFSLPINRKANNALALTASLNNEAISSQIADLQLTLTAEGNAWIARLNDSTQRVITYKNKLIPLANQSLEITKSSYQSNTATILDLIDSEQTLLKLETEYWRAAADAWIARWHLATLSGGLWLD